MSFRLLFTFAAAITAVAGSAQAGSSDFLKDYGIATVTTEFNPSGMNSVPLTVTVGAISDSAAAVGIPANAEITSVNGIDLKSTGPVSSTNASRNLQNAETSVTNSSNGIISVSYKQAAAAPEDPATLVNLVNFKVAKPAIATLGLSFANDTATNLSLETPVGNALAAGIRESDSVAKVGGTEIKNQGSFFQHAYLALAQTQSLPLVIHPGGDENKELSVTIPAVPASVTAASGPLTQRGVTVATGPPVDYPEYLDANKVSRAVIQSPLAEELKAEVVSARVELYYFRDAHRAAQIINRRVKSYNRASVTAAEKAAEAARSANLDAEDNLQTKQADAQRQADILQQMERTLAETVSQYRQALAPNSQTASQAADLKAAIETLLPNISQQRQKVTAAEAEVLTAEQNEQRTARTRFQAEVSAGTVDPDTYVPGNPNSWDPVAQVSISVIGEGVLFLRGPRQGVVEIRRMLDEIDHPVGQVKIGVMTIQLNGESGFRMDNTVQRIEGNLSLGRFLTYVTGQFFAKAVSETARRLAFETKTRAAGSWPRETTAPFTDNLGAELTQLNASRLSHDSLIQQEARLRWKAYLQAFFGEDFLWALYEIDPDTPLLDPLNKVVSLNSTDTLTLGEALIYSGLAKDSVRAEIISRFQTSLMEELPEKEFQWIRTTGAYKWYDVRWWGDAQGGMKSVLKNAARKYNFAATTAFLDREQPGNNELNPFHRQILRLVQLMTLRNALRTQFDSLVQKRTLAQRTGLLGASAANARLLTQLEMHLTQLEEQEVETMDSLRGTKAAIDNLLKRAMIAMEDDVYAQFYNPAIERIRKASRSFDVELGVVERTTILTNNRAFAKVEPQSTYEFDLPKRDILLAEALKSAYALQQDIGPLLQDPSFQTLASKFTSTGNVVQNVLPGLSSQTDQQSLILGQNLNAPQFNSELEKLIPDPAIYRFQNGTGYEVRPVIQPDGQSVVFDFNYMYTTDLLEPTNSGQKGLGRVKRHFVDTEVQLGNLEWREISRYEIALKAARNGQGVPLLQDIPVAGALFRPLPSDGASIQKNIIVGQTTIYPTIQDLLGLRPAELSHDSLQHLVDLRNRALRTSSYQTDELTQKLNSILAIPECPKPTVVCPKPEVSEFEKIPRVNLQKAGIGDGQGEEPCQCPECQKRRAAQLLQPLQVPAIDRSVIPEVPAAVPTVVPAAGRTELPVIEQTGFRKPVGSAPRRVTAPRPLDAAQ